MLDDGHHEAAVALSVMLTTDGDRDVEGGRREAGGAKRRHPTEQTGGRSRARVEPSPPAPTKAEQKEAKRQGEAKLLEELARLPWGQEPFVRGNLITDSGKWVTLDDFPPTLRDALDGQVNDLYTGESDPTTGQPRYRHVSHAGGDYRDRFFKGLQVQLSLHGSLTTIARVGHTRVGALMAVAAKVDPRLRVSKSAGRWVQWILRKPTHVDEWLASLGGLEAVRAIDARPRAQGGRPAGLTQGGATKRRRLMEGRNVSAILPVEVLSLIVVRVLAEDHHTRLALTNRAFRNAVEHINPASWKEICIMRGYVQDGDVLQTDETWRGRYAMRRDLHNRILDHVVAGNWTDLGRVCGRLSDTYVMSDEIILAALESASHCKCCKVRILRLVFGHRGSTGPEVRYKLGVWLVHYGQRAFRATISSDAELFIQIAKYLHEYSIVISDQHYLDEPTIRRLPLIVREFYNKVPRP